jgi:hypothetical protein
MTNGLGYCPLKETKSSKISSLNINTIKKDSPKLTLTLGHPKLIKISGLDFYPLKETTKSLLNVNVITQSTPKRFLRNYLN